MRHLINIRVRIILIAFALTFALCSLAFSQGCNPDEIINLPGIYKGPGKGSVNGISKADLEKQQAFAGKI